jgi:anti-anti-sigma regulatory factor
VADHTVEFHGGSLGRDDAAALAKTLADAIIYRDDDLTVDCSQTHSLDLTAVGVLVEASALLATEGRQLHLRP